jgi:hypothetical protein
MNFFHVNVSKGPSIQQNTYFDNYKNSFELPVLSKTKINKLIEDGYTIEDKGGYLIYTFNNGLISPQFGLTREANRKIISSIINNNTNMRRDTIYFLAFVENKINDLLNNYLFESKTDDNTNFVNRDEYINFIYKPLKEILDNMISKTNGVDIEIEYDDNTFVNFNPALVRLKTITNKICFKFFDTLYEKWINSTYQEGLRCNLLLPSYGSLADFCVINLGFEYLPKEYSFIYRERETGKGYRRLNKYSA